MSGKLFFLGVRAKKRKWAPIFGKTICVKKKGVNQKVQILPLAASNNLILVFEIFSFKLSFFHLAPLEGFPTRWRGEGLGLPL